ncbi:hypothetical protein PR202_ga00160 [Eleusine coracana subsp. coracana]|uniref:SPX domain-containing protein n=1 Tax=Eleusine coracana subsp. coracana TaxID=191504 RepID=A0AAV5BFE5_ELECO|nr:hypothetical protein PR202_ga00160 [Eleusine coracana subsp. coracana]
MKFGKRLKKQVEESLPEWRDKFLAYKRLKRLVRLISGGNLSPRRATAEAAFVRVLDGEVERFNAFFLEQEEEFVIRQRELQEMVKKVAAGEEAWPSGAAEMRRVRKEIVDLHGEMVLLLNYSAINYTGLAKILKKYDKRTGRLLRLPFIEKALQQPFFATELISRLVHECEATMEAIFDTEREHTGTRMTPWMWIGFQNDARDAASILGFPLHFNQQISMAYLSSDHVTTGSRLGEVAEGVSDKADWNHEE